MILCMGERHSFPDDQFVQSEYGRLIHKVKLLHYADNGDLVDPNDVPPIPGIETLLSEADAKRFLDRRTTKHDNKKGSETPNE